MRKQWRYDRMELSHAELPDGMLLVHNGIFHIVGKKWWIYDPNSKYLQTAVEAPPWLYTSGYAIEGEMPDVVSTADAKILHRVIYTNGFGPIVQTRSGPRQTARLYHLDPALIPKGTP
jgi:hypothetical protein